MNNTFPSQLKTRIEVLAYYQIVGGVFGIGLIVYLIAQTGAITGLMLLIFASAVSLYCYSVYCGKVLKSGETGRGLVLSKINQLFQTFEFAVGGYAFKYVSGGSVNAGINITNDFKFYFNLTPSSFQVTFNKDEDLIIVGFNMLAIYLVYYITRLQETIADRELLLNTPVAGSQNDNSLNVEETNTSI